MPYKHGKIQYGLPHEEYPAPYIKESTEQLKEILALDTEPAAITLCFMKEQYEAYPVQELTSAMPYCVMVKQAFRGKSLKCRLEHHKCDGGTTALALEPSTEKIESGEEYFSYNLYSSVAVARRMRASIKSLHRMPVSTYGVSIVPLESCTLTPDVIIILCNAYQAMRLIQGFEYKTGRKPDIDMGAMQAMCSELTVSPYLSGEMNVSVMCPSTRMLCKWKPEDMAVAVPYEIFTDVVDGVLATKMDY